MPRRRNLAAKRDGKIYGVFEEALRRYLEETGGPEAFREETRGDGAHEERQPRPRVPSFPLVGIRR